MNDQVILDIVGTILRSAAGPLFDAIVAMVRGEEARRVESIRPTAGAPAIIDALADLERGKPES